MEPPQLLTQAPTFVTVGNHVSQLQFSCVDDVLSWTTANRLQLNPSKTEVPRCSFRSTTAPYSNYGSPYMLDLCPARCKCSKPWCVHRHRRQHESAHRRHRPIVFRRSPAGAQRAAVFTTSGLADTHQSPRRQQSRLLLFGADRCLQSSQLMRASSTM